MIEISKIETVPEAVWNILVEYGQHDKRFHLGELIQYNLSEILEILRLKEDELNYRIGLTKEKINDSESNEIN